jgi:glucuronoarabinoxylan endo-1,4-beta-xylanase
MTRSVGSWLALSSVLACSPEPTGHLAVRASALDPEVVIDAADEHQHITGFGASSAWTSPSMGDARADEFFSTETGIGLSLLRLRISPEGTSDEIATALSAQERGVKVWAAPWSPPGAWKSNGTDNNGGLLLLEHYQDWADRLADFVENTEAAGVDLFALSVQNEPDWVAEWETCEWTPEDLATFIGDYLGPTLDERGLSTTVKVVGPESANWDSFPSYADAILEHEAARAVVDVIATHSYGGSAFAYTKPAENDKEFWETEVSGSGDVDHGINSGLFLASMIHTHLTLAEVNAWHFWWMQPDGIAATANDSLMSDEQMTKRGYVLGNFSRFVRPGAIRVGATPETSGSIDLSAFKNAESGPLAVVAINRGLSAATVRFQLNNLEIDVRSVTPWVTDETRALAAEEPIEVTEGGFSYDLPALSVTTLVTSPTFVEPGMGGAGGAEGGDDGGAANAGEGGTAGTGGSGGSGSGTGASAGTSSAGAPSTGGSEECCSDTTIPKTPPVACMCRTPGSLPGSENHTALFSVSALLGLFALRKSKRLRSRA